MTAEQHYFLQLLADHISGKRPSDPPEAGLNWELLFRLADTHQLTDILYSQCRSHMTDCPALKARLEQKQASHMFYMINRDQALKELEAKLTREQIPFFVVKGPEIAACYPAPALRASGDIDILLSTQDREKAHRILTGDGYRCTAFENHEWSYESKRAHFELHDQLIYRTDYNPENCVEYCSHCWEYARELPGTSRRRLETSFHMVYLFLHLRKHMLYEGVGFRQFYDLAVMARFADPDWERITEDLKKLGLEQFGRSCMSFCRYWFGVESPLGDGQPEADFAEQATQKIFANGVFGSNDPSNAVGQLTSAMTASRLPAFLRAPALMLKTVFPGYRAMKDVPDYAGLKGRPWLLPAYWVYRWVHVLRVRRSHALRRLAAPVTQADSVRQRQKQLNDWGL